MSLSTRMQYGQSMTEYIVVCSMLVFVFLFDVNPKKEDWLKVPDWDSDGFNDRALECPNGAEECNVVELLAQVFRNRNDGYTYAISSTFYPERAIDYDLDIFNSVLPSMGVGGNPAEGEEDDVEEDDGEDPFADAYEEGDSGIDVGIVTKGTADENVILGQVDENGCVVDKNDKIVGKEQDGFIVATDEFCTVIEDENGDTEVIGIAADLQNDGTVLDENGDLIGTL